MMAFGPGDGRGTRDRVRHRPPEADVYPPTVASTPSFVATLSLALARASLTAVIAFASP